MPAAARFDVRDFARTAHGSLSADFDRREFEGFPLDREAIVATAYLLRLEHAALARRAEAPAPGEPRVAAFDAVWAQEKHWIAEALADVLDASPRIRGISGRPQPPARRPRAVSVSRALLATVLGERLRSARLAVGAFDAHVIMRGYQHLAHLSLHPEMEKLAAAIIPIIDRHAEFFVEEAEARLALSPAARLLARILLETRRMPSAESDLDAALAAEGRALLWSRDDRGLVRIDRVLSRRFGVHSTAAARLARPASGPDVRLARWAGAFAADVVAAYRAAS